MLDLNLGQGVFTSVETAKILNIKRTKVSYWVRNYLKDKLHKHTKHHYTRELGSNTVVFNFYSLIELFVFNQLREKKFKTKDILKAHEAMSSALNTPYPFACEKLLVSGGQLFFKKGSDILSADNKLQYSIKEVILKYAEKISFGKDGMAKEFYPLGKEKSVVINPEHQFGLPVLKGTNITIDIINNLLDAGESKNDIARLYNLQQENIEHAIEFASAA